MQVDTGGDMKILHRKELDSQVFHYLTSILLTNSNLHEKYIRNDFIHCAINGGKVFFLSNTFVLLSCFLIDYTSGGSGGVLQHNCEVMLISVRWLAAVYM